MNSLRSTALKTSIPSPLLQIHEDSELSKQEKMELIANHFSCILEVLGLDLSNDSLRKTPWRIAKMYVEEIFSGLDQNNFPEVALMKDCLSQSTDQQVVLIKDISVTSYCEHHFVPFLGKAQFAYIPNGKVIGLSKINRIVDYFCKRPQIQERLTTQIIDALENILDTKDLALKIEAKHLCVALRGVRDQGSSTATQILRGKFLNDPLVRSEFIQGT